MSAAGFDAEEAIEPLLARMPDYEQHVTHQQVAFIMRKGYEPARCRKLKGLGMCPRECDARARAGQAGGEAAAVWRVVSPFVNQMATQ